MSEWKALPAEEYCDKVADGTHDTPKPMEVGEYLVTSKHITGGKVDLSGAYRISKEDFEKINVRSKVDKWDVLLTMIGTVGEVVLVDHEPNYAIKNIGLFKCGDEIKARWLKYYLQSPNGKAEIESRLGGTTQEYIALGELRKLLIPLPPLPEQRAIAGVLSSLDDKIDLLHRQNKTLEGMAEALWRKMFVEEADPGWSKGKLGDIVQINPPRSIKKGTIATYLDMSNMPTNGPFPMKWVQREFSSGMKFKNGDTIIARITPCLENGKTAYVNFLSEGEIGWGSTEYIVLTPKSGYCPEWYYFLARNDDLRDFAIQNMTGTSGRQRVSGDSISQYEIAIPPMNIFEKFKAFTGPVMEHIKYNSIQIRTLSHLRDTLLPKLMSGEVRVKL